jgi:micrococcal nuclease
MFLTSLWIGMLWAMSPLTSPGGMVELDGKPTPVHWADGDSFTVLGNDKGARLAGYNTLESYGPVHQWGEWTPIELYALARAATNIARKRPWRCTQLEGTGGYGRLVVDCPDLRDALLSAGLAHTFSVDGPGSAAAQALQNEAMAQARGMWQKGVPAGLITSLHSADERDDGSAYDRVCDPVTGHAAKRAHTAVYTVCQTVCHDGSCMVYVPYAQRYGDSPADCLGKGPAPAKPKKYPAKSGPPRKRR